MKNIKDLIIESNVYDRGLTQACKILNNIYANMLNNKKYTKVK